MSIYAKLLTFVTFLVYFTNASIQVPKIKLNDGNEMPAIALGTWLGNTTFGRLPPESHEVEQAVKWALDAGYRHIDTAWIYKVEDQVGRGLKGSEVKREDIFITTKLWNDRHAGDAVVPALRESLKNLQLDYVDLYLIHWPCGQFSNGTFDITDYLDTWRGMIEAKKLGLTKSIGLSNFNQEQIQRILDHGLKKPAALQVEINLNLQQPELLAFCKSHNIAVQGYTPFGSLFYSKAAPGAPLPRVDDTNLVEIANKYNKTVPQIALRYLVELGVVPLPKSLTKTRIEQNVDVFDFQLTENEKQILKNFNKGYRIFVIARFSDHPYYPFGKSLETSRGASSQVCDCKHDWSDPYSPNSGDPMPPEFSGTWETECISAKFPPPTLLCAGYSVKIELGVVPLPKSLTKYRIEQNLDVFGFELTDLEKAKLKGFNTGYRTIPQYKWLDHPYYPFKKML